jgi:hypothetical protein
MESLPTPPTHPETVSIEVTHCEPSHGREDEANTTEEKFLSLVGLLLVVMEFPHQSLKLVLLVSELAREESAVSLMRLSCDLENPPSPSCLTTQQPC